MMSLCLFVSSDGQSVRKLTQGEHRTTPFSLGDFDFDFDDGDDDDDEDTVFFVVSSLEPPPPVVIQPVSSPSSTSMAMSCMSPSQLSSLDTKLSGSISGCGWDRWRIMDRIRFAPAESPPMITADAGRFVSWMMYRRASVAWRSWVGYDAHGVRVYSTRKKATS